MGARSFCRHGSGQDAWCIDGSGLEMSFSDASLMQEQPQHTMAFFFDHLLGVGSSQDRRFKTSANPDAG